MLLEQEGAPGEGRMDFGQTISGLSQSDASVEGKQRLLSSQVGWMAPEEEVGGA